MDVKHVNPFLDSFLNIMPQLGVNNIKKGRLSVKDKHIKSPGVVIIVGIIGDIRGNVIYTLSNETALSIASTMMMGMPVKELDEMAQSAISELSNMLTANAAINFESTGINIDISTPTLVYGEFTANASSDKVLCVEMFVDELPFEINIALEKI